MSFPRLRIAFITHKFGHQYGGAEAYGVELMNELSKHHDVFIYTHQYDSQCQVDLPHTIVPSPASGPSWWRSYRFAQHVEQALANQQFDIVHSHVNNWVADVDVLHVKSVRYSKITQASALKRLWHAISPRTAMYLHLEKDRVHLKPPRRTVVVSKSLQHQLQQAYHTAYPFDVITPGVHLPEKNLTERQQTRQQLGFTDQDTVCLLVARNPQAKGLDCLLASLQQLPSEIKLLVVGVAPQQRAALQSKLQKQGLEQRVVFIEQSHQISPYYQAADLCVHPTLNDSFGMAPLEAMSYGLPVILSSSQYCGFAHHVQDQHQALILQDPRNSSELAAAIQQLVQNSSLRLQLSQQGLALAQEFSWSNIAQRYLYIYAEVIAARLHKRKPTLIDPLAS